MAWLLVCETAKVLPGWTPVAWPEVTNPAGAVKPGVLFAAQLPGPQGTGSWAERPLSPSNRARATARPMADVARSLRRARLEGSMRPMVSQSCYVGVAVC